MGPFFHCDRRESAWTIGPVLSILKERQSPTLPAPRRIGRNAYLLRIQGLGSQFPPLAAQLSSAQCGSASPWRMAYAVASARLATSVFSYARWQQARPSACRILWREEIKRIVLGKMIENISTNI